MISTKIEVVYIMNKYAIKGIVNLNKKTDPVRGRFFL